MKNGDFVVSKDVWGYVAFEAVLFLIIRFRNSLFFS